MGISIKVTSWISKKMDKGERISLMGMCLRVRLGMDFLRVKAGMYGIVGLNSKAYLWEVFEQEKVFSKPKMALATMEILTNRSLKVCARSSCQTGTGIMGFSEKAKKMERVLFT